MSPLESLIQQLANGLMLGLVYALVAAGASLIWGVAGLINFAHGELFMTAAFALYVLMHTFHMPYELAAVVAVVFMCVFGAVMEAVLIRQVLNRPWQTQLIVTIGVSVTLTSIANVLFGSFALAIHTAYTNADFQVGPVSLSVQRAIMIIGTVLAFATLQIFISHSKIGKAMRAVSQNREACVAVGIDVQRVALVTFAIASGLAALAAVLYAPLINLLPTMGQPLTLKAFVVIIMGGIGRLDHTLYAALFLGVAEAMTAQFISVTWVDAIAFVVMLGVLAIRPQGLFARRKVAL
jgi:branched-chain amino acid transport system permease protein